MFVYFGKCHRFSDINDAWIVSFFGSPDPKLRETVLSRNGLLKHIKRSAYQAGWLWRECLSNITLWLPSNITHIFMNGWVDKCFIWIKPNFRLLLKVWCSYQVWWRRNETFCVFLSWSANARMQPGMPLIYFPELLTWILRAIYSKNLEMFCLEKFKLSTLIYFVLLVDSKMLSLC